MAAEKIGLIMKLWNGFRVLAYAARNEALSSSETVAMFWDMAMEVKSRPLGGVREEG